MPFAKVGAGKSRRIFYRKFGSDDASHKILFTMGLGGDNFMFEPQIEYFTREERRDTFSIVVYDNRGVGKSDGAPGIRWTTRCMAQDALDMLDSLDWNHNIHLVGLSMGGMITQELAKMDLERFASMSLLSTTFGGLTSLGLFMTKPMGLYTIFRTFTAFDASERLNRGLQILFPPSFLEDHGDEVKRVLVERGKRSLAEGSRQLPLDTVVKQTLAVMTHRTSRKDFERLNAHFGDATLVVTGSEDILVHERNSRILARALEGAKLVVLPDAGHGASEQLASTVNHEIELNVLRGAMRRGIRARL